MIDTFCRSGGIWVRHVDNSYEANHINYTICSGQSQEMPQTTACREQLWEPCKESILNSNKHLPQTTGGDWEIGEQLGEPSIEAVSEATAICPQDTLCD